MVIIILHSANLITDITTGQFNAYAFAPKVSVFNSVNIFQAIEKVNTVLILFKKEYSRL